MIRLVQKILDSFGLKAVSIKKLEGYGSINYKIIDDHGNQYVLKFYRDQSALHLIEEEIEFVELIKDHLPYKIPYTILKNDKKIHHYEDGSFARLLPFIEGVFLADAKITPVLLNNLGRAIALMALQLSKCEVVHVLNKQSVWDLLYALKNKEIIPLLEQSKRRKIVDHFLEQFEHIALPILQNLPRQLIHNDFNEWNVLCNGDQICGVIDLGDATVAPRICDLAIGLAYIMQKHNSPIDVACEVIKGYNSQITLTEKEIEILPFLITARIVTSVCESAKAKNEGYDTEYIVISEKGGWELLEKWIEWDPKKLVYQFKKATEKTN
ncbi:MAG: phosphotransferase [Saprospiraceae bacterium]